MDRYKKDQLEELVKKAIREGRPSGGSPIYDAMQDKVLDGLEKNIEQKRQRRYFTKMTQEELATDINIDLIKMNSQIYSEFLEHCEKEGGELWTLIMECVGKYYDELI